MARSSLTFMRFDDLRSHFEPKRIENPMIRKRQRVHRKFGAFVRKRAMSSIRRRKNPSKPGRPPTNQTGQLKRSIFFAADEHTATIGPTKFNQVVPDIKLDGRTTVPELLEDGGDAGVVETAIKTVDGGVVWIRRDLRKRGAVALFAAIRQRLENNQGWVLSDGRNRVIPAGRNRFRTYTIEARPFMRPAFSRELTDSLPRMWRGEL